MNRHILLDCNYLCHRTFHALPELTHHGVKTQVMFGFLRDAWKLRGLYGDSLIFCFDEGTSRRKDLYPNYKGNRQPEVDEDKLKARKELYKQMELLRDKYLPRIGYRNIFSKQGFEADDIIASLVGGVDSVGTIGTQEDCVIVSSDEDMFQLLREGVSIHKPGRAGNWRFITYESFQKDYGLEPKLWPDVKALAGCSSDNIKGIKGVGNKTAVQYLRGRLDEKRAAYGRITSPEGKKIRSRNLELVKLPLIGTGKFPLRPNKDSLAGWKFVCDKLGINSVRKLEH